MAGVGDLLFQVSHFFLFCARLGLSPLIYLPTGQSRNVCGLSDLFELFGFYRARRIVESAPIVECIPFSAALSSLASGAVVSERYFRFDNPCYGHAELERLRAGGVGHPDLLDVFRRSALFERVMRRRSAEDRCRVVVHVRRGDVAQVQLNSVLSMLAEGVDPFKVAHVSGVYSESELKSSIDPEAYRRFKTVAKYKDVLVRELKHFGADCQVCLLSDGFTRLASALICSHSSMFCDGLRADQLEDQLNGELQPLVQMSHVSLIGETADALIDSIVYGLSADMIVTGSPGMFRLMIEFMQLDIQIVTVNSYVELMRS